jgi:hypothetical protein
MGLNRICPQFFYQRRWRRKFCFNVSKRCFHLFSDVMSSSPVCVRQTVLNNRSCSRLITCFNGVVLSTKWRTLRCAQQAWQHSMPLANEHLPNTRFSKPNFTPLFHASWTVHIPSHTAHPIHIQLLELNHSLNRETGIWFKYDLFLGGVQSQFRQESRWLSLVF